MGSNPKTSSAYKKIEGDKEQWYIDEPAAQIVRRIFALCLAGKGPTQIARQLEKEKVLMPTAYFHSIGRKTSNPVPANIYGWHESTVEHILENQQYTGCTVNGKSTTVSYKVHKVIENPKEEYQIIPNTQELLSEMEQKSVDMRLLLQGLREFTDMKELTPTIVNKLIRRIEVHNPEKKHARKSVKVDIYFTAVGMVSLPDEQEIRKMMEQMRSASQIPKQLTA